MLRGWRLRLRSEADVSMPCHTSCIILSRNTHHIDTTVTRNSNDAVERSHINAHNRHVCSSLRGIRLLGKGYQKGRGEKRGSCKVVRRRPTAEVPLQVESEVVRLAVK